MYVSISPPSPFDATKRWKEFRDRLKALPQDDPAVQSSIELADQILHLHRTNPAVRSLVSPD